MLFRKILVGLDGSELSWRAFRRAIAIALDQRSELWAVSVEERLPYYAALAGEVAEEDIRQTALFERLQGEAREFAEANGLRLRTTISRGPAATRIEEIASENAFDLIVVGHRGGNPPWHRFAGSTAEHLIDHAPCAVLVERPQLEDEYDIARLLGQIETEE